MGNKRLPWIAAALAFACARSPSSPAPVQQHVALHAVTTCPAVERAIQDAAVTEMREQLEGGLHWRMMWGDVTTAAGGPAATPSASPPPAAYTTTNVQVAGVDEPDFVKNDATRIFTLSGNKLIAASSWPPANLALASTLEIEGWPTSMFLDEQGRIAVISQVPSDPQLANPSMCPVGRGMAFMCGYWGPATAKLTLVDATDAAHLAVSGEVWLPGWSAHARRIGSQVHVVLTDAPRWPDSLKWWPSDPAVWNDPSKLADALHALEDENEKIIRKTPLESWLPPAQRKLRGGETVNVPYDCAQFSVGNAPVRLGFVTVATLDLDHPDAPPARNTILGEGGMIYASVSSLYVASYHWWWWQADGNVDWTYLHKFDISKPGGATYVASGGFAGHPLDQFSMDESADGHLRVAVNTMKLRFDGAGPMWQRMREDMGSAVRVLDKDLRVVGEIDPLSPGEWVRSSRFMGERGFVVTFKSIDPLFALDLKDPAHPKKAGVLELPGFSTYLQPILDDAHLLAIGVDLPESAANWRDRSLQLSVFDVSDLSAPVRTVHASIGSAWAYSEALWDHHAFNWFPQKGLLAVPFFDWDPSATNTWGSFVSDLRVYEVTAATIVAKGALSMKDLFLASGRDQWAWSWSPAIRRSVMAADVQGNTFVYGISDAGIRVAPLSALDTPLATAPFPR